MNERENTNSHLNDLLSITKIGTWEWDISTGNVVYSTAWADLLGYTVSNLSQTLEAHENMIFAEDLANAKEEMQNLLTAKKPYYEATLRMKRHDGSILWVEEKGKIIESDEDGNPLRIFVLSKDISDTKAVAESLSEKEEFINFAVNVAEFGIWDWDIPNNKIVYNQEYLEILGYSHNEITGTLEEWESMCHPEDLPLALELLTDYIDGKIPSYECEIRMLHKNGNTIWTRDVGRIVARDENGVPTRIIGGHLNIEPLKRAEERFGATLEELEHHREFLESEIEKRTSELMEQDKMLWVVNDISQKLFSLENQEYIDKVIQYALESYCNASGRESISLWKNETIEGKDYCSLLYKWDSENSKKLSDVDYKALYNQKNVEAVLAQSNEEKFASDFSDLLKHAERTLIPYDEFLPSLHENFMHGQGLNSFISDLSPFERFHIGIRGVKSILVTPIVLNDEVWGFIGCDNCETDELFSEVEEKMLSILGFFLANSIQKNDSEQKMREAEERIQLMLNATPLCCNLWTRDLQNMSCNDEAVRLFDLSSQEEYLERFFELSPEYQPCGRLSGEMAAEYVLEAFDKGACRFEWMHQKLDGTLIPAEITLVRIKYKDDYIVAGYTRDLRELKAMLATLQAKEDDLRAARDEALLSSKAKTNFLANMSHEIRTPMNAISGFAEIILRESKDRQNAEHATGIKNACSNLLNIVNDILDISKVESGKLEIVNSEYELSSLLNDVITISRMRLGDKPLQFATNIDSKLPAKLIGDQIRIKQILINLLSNAIKFTEKGSISLRVSGELFGDKATLRFEVSDTGFGIKESDLSLLFAEFQRINTTKNRNIEGTGLGLAISKQLCEMMHGQIEVQSSYGEGSTFSVTIMQDCPEYEQISLVTEEKCILLFEPREVYLHSIAQTIENLGSTCIACKNQVELHRQIKHMDYDFIITPAVYYEKVKSLMQENGLKTTLVILADYGESINESSIRSVFLPVSCLQMADILNGHRNSDDFGSYDDIRHKFVAPTARVLVVDDNAVNLKVAAGLMAPYQFTIDTADSGLKAVEMVGKYHYDLVFMDHMMPEMDGIDATIAIRKLEDEYFTSLPIIALTANALVGTKEMFLREGMNDFLSKPIEVGKLALILSKWLPKSKIIYISDVKSDDKEVETLDCDIFGIDVEHGIRAVGGNKEDYLRILSCYYEDGLKKKGSLLQHFSDNEIISFRIEVHALKSTSATIGALALAHLAGELENAALNLDIEFIDGNIKAFLEMLKNILDEIAPFVNGVDDLEIKFDENQASGCFVMLGLELDKLYNAAELANISEIEDILAVLSGFAWPIEITSEITAINQHISMFDYDEVLECVLKLQDLIKLQSKSLSR